MKIMIGADHAGFELKEKVAQHLHRLGHEVVDVGTHGKSSVDYPVYAFQVAEGVAKATADRGILICGSGIGMCITANRVPGVRAALTNEPYAAKMSRRHNDSNVLCLGGRFIGEDLAMAIIDVWLTEPFEGDRHARRIAMIDTLTQNRSG
jgi:ribose 5-phosphate isomerase B